MTRFARAKGSKASNERVPEAATPWKELKKSIEVGIRPEADLSLPQKTLVEIRKSLKKEPVASQWVDLEELQQTADKKKKKVKQLDPAFVEVQENKPEKAKKNKKRKLPEFKEENNLTTEIVSKKVKKKKKDHNTEETDFMVDSVVKTEGKKKKSKVESSESCVENPTLDTRKKIKKQKRKENKLEESESEGQLMKKNKNRWKKETKIKNKLNDRINNTEQQMKKSKPKDGTRSRRKPDIGPKTVNINGEEFTIVLYDGFYVKQDDAERLKKLRKDMIQNKLSMAEINRAMKLERRRAEKNLSRAKKKVCFHCRKFGHNLSYCPELSEKNDIGTGICYKCGSTEHTHFECKVTHNEEYRFATCFICKEQGHLARQCPDNPRGLYPHGGACKMCGDVTHLKKDCPQFVAEKEESSVTVNFSNNAKLEALEEDKIVQPQIRNVKKIVKF